MKHADEKRDSQRIKIEVPFYIGHEKAITRDIIRTGAYFLTAQSFVEAGDLSFSPDPGYTLPEKPIKLDCQGEVIRVERHDEMFGIAAKTNEFQYLHLNNRTGTKTVIKHIETKPWSTKLPPIKPKLQRTR